MARASTSVAEIAGLQFRKPGRHRSMLEALCQGNSLTRESSLGRLDHVSRRRPYRRTRHLGSERRGRTTEAGGRDLRDSSVHNKDLATATSFIGSRGCTAPVHGWAEEAVVASKAVAQVGIDPHKTLTAPASSTAGAAPWPPRRSKVSGVGHRALEDWASGFGPVRRWGIGGGQFPRPPHRGVPDRAWT